MPVTAVQILNNHVLQLEDIEHEAVEEMQKDLDVYRETHSQRRPHRGRGMEGRTPHAVSKAGIPRKRTRKPSAGKEV